MQEKKLSLIVDSREKSNRIVRQLVDQGCDIQLKQLEIADYILDEHTGVEFKTKQDFVDSIVDGRLFNQAGSLARNFNKPLIVVQGEEDIYSLRNIHSNAIIGALSTLATSFRIPILFTKNDDETAQLFMSIIKRQKTDLATFSMHAGKPKEEKQLQEYIVTSFPTIGPQVAKNLLTHFGSVKQIVNANIEDLAKVEKVGKGKAETIYNILRKHYSHS
jgi:Fanconi anemia group M protein